MLVQCMSATSYSLSNQACYWSNIALPFFGIHLDASQRSFELRPVVWESVAVTTTPW